MTSYCNFDSLLSIDGRANKESSDCYESCINIDGCDPNNLGNGKCDSSCNTENCGFDWGDCTCAPGCYDYMLGDGHCDESCDNWDCDLDNHDCGQCADGCFPIMLGNGVCNPECNNEECLYDYKDCKCAEGCLLANYGACKPECLVASCNYDKIPQYPSSWCKNSSLAIFSSYQQTVRKDYLYVVHLEECYKASNYQCTLTKALNLNTCYKECYILECNYANGNCDFLSLYCNKAYQDSQGISCLSCRKSFLRSVSALVDNRCLQFPQVALSPSIFPDNTYVVVPVIDTSTEKNPHIYFVCPDKISVPNSNSGIGTYFSPFKSLVYALNRNSYKYSVFYLMECNGYYLTSYLFTLADYVIIDDSFAFAGRHVKITPLNSSNKIVIRRVLDDNDGKNHFAFGFIFLNPLYIELNNIIFDWKNTSSSCTNEKYCDYCPYTTHDFSSNIYYSDQGEIIKNFLLPDWCLGDKNRNFIKIQSGNLMLKNVSFINFRAGFNSILYMQGDTNVTFSSVTFDNIKVNDDYGSWVMLWMGTKYSNFKFENGVVSRLNNGYELNDPISTKGFLNVSSINSIVFRNVEFQNNAVIKQSATGIRIASLFFMNLFEAFWIDSCSFLYNYCDFGIIYILQQLNNAPIEFDDDGVVIYSKYSHIHIFNSNFISNYGKTGGVLYASYEFESQNVLIENSTFALNGIESGALINIESNYADENYLVDRKVNATLSDGNAIEGNYLAKWIKLYNLNFTRNYSGENGLIQIIKMINVNWKNITMDSNGLILSEAMNANSILLKYYIDNPTIYAKHNITDPSDLNCQALSAVSGLIYFSIDEIEINNNFCKYSLPNIIISNTTNSAIKSTSFYDNKGSGSSGTCLAFVECTDCEIISSKFYFNINNQLGSPGVISSLSNLSIQNCTFSNNIGSLFFEGQNLTLLSSHFDSNSSPASSGGAIYFSISQESLYNSILFISNTTFENNFCSFSGGAIYITKTTPMSLLLEFKIEDTTFYNNQALDGSCIYIDNSLALTSDSSISSSSFLENKASFSATVSASYQYGVLIFDNCIFLKNVGPYSSGLSIDIGENNEETPSKIILNSCTFQYNSGNITFSLGNTYTNSTVEVDSCIFEHNIGSMFSLDNDYAFVKNSRVQHNFSPTSGGVLNIKNSAVFKSVNTTYLNCSSNVNGGVASISLNSQFICFSCIFQSNYASSSGGVIYADSDGQFYLNDSIISKNSCKNKGSAIFMASSLANSLINNTEIYENHAYNDGTLFILSSLLSIFSSRFYSNKADGKNPGLYLDDSNIIITNTSFFNQIGKEGCFIYTSSCYANITNSTFYKGFSVNSGIAIRATSSNIEISSSAFSDLVSNDIGGSIYLYEDSSLSVKNSKFLNSGSSIDSYSSSIFVEHTSFKSYTNTAIIANQIENLQISSSEFFDGSGINGGALYCVECSAIAIISSSFTNNSGKNGGAIYIKNEENHIETSKVTVVFSNFKSNVASNGGAIWTSNIKVEISSSIFIENKAESLRTENQTEIADGLGGAIKMSGKSSHLIFEISSSSFINNSATCNGGAINWDDSNPEFKNNIFQNNSALYGPDIASFPIKMIFLGNDTRRLQSEAVLEDSNLTLGGIASGQKHNPLLVFALVDNLYQIITTDTTSQAQIKAVSADTVISGSTVAYAKHGIYYFDDYAISAKPGSSVHISIVSSAIDTKKVSTSSDNLQMSSSLSINVNLRLCEIGEATVGLTCEICPEFYYNIDTKISKCLDCPSSAICYGNFSIVPKPGYWRDNKFTDKFWKCPYSSACLGSPNDSDLSLTGTCEKGYENNMCHSCESGYSRLYKNECQVCPDTISNVFRWIGVSLFLLFISMVILKITRDSWHKPNSFSAAVYLKIFWNYLQIMIIIATYNLNWPYEAIEFFYIQTSLDYIGGQLFSFDCFLQLSYSKSRIYYIKILITSLTPFAVVFLCLFCWVFIYKIKRKRISEIKDDYISTCIVFIFLLQPSIIDTMFSVFSCKEINSGEFWLNVDLGIRCWDHDHTYYTLLLALPTIIIWVIAVPMICLINLIKNKKHLEEMWLKKRYSFLYNGYNPKHYYWEFVILFYKVILISCSVFLSNISVNIQALTATLFFVLFLYLHTRNEPFREAFFNKAETFSRLVSLIAILAGLFFLTDDLGTAATYFLVFLLIMANILFIFYVLTNFLLQFVIINRLLMIIRRIFISKEGKYAIKVLSSNEIEQDVSSKEGESRDGKLASTMINSGNTRVENISIFRGNLSFSSEIDPFSSEQSISFS